MLGERETDREALMGRYGISRRLATRVVALLQNRVDISPTVLEMAAPGSAAERMLLSRQILQKPHSIDEGELQRLAGECGVPEADLLTVVREGPQGWTTIALQEDVLAERAEQQAASNQGLETGQLVKAAPAGMSRVETEELFTPHLVAQLKLSALTSQDVRERTEALRKLVFAPIGGAQKASIFVNVLVDSEAEARVRREAVRCLEQIGFRSDLADGVRGLFGADPQEVIHAIRRLETLLEEAESAEKGVALAVALEVLKRAQEPPVVREVLRLISSLAPMLVQNAERTEQFVQNALGKLARNFQRLRLGVEGALLACYKEDAGLIRRVAWAELRRSDDAQVRSFLLNLLASLEPDPERVAELARVALSEILNPALRESEKARLRYGLAKLGEWVPDAVIQRLRQCPPRERPELIRLLNVACTEGKVSRKTLNSAAQTLLDLLKVADSMSRKAVLDADLCADRRVAKKIQRELAKELLTHIDEFQLEDSQGGICDTLERIGIPALQPMFDYVKRRYPQKQAASVFLSIGRIIRNNPEAVPDELVGLMGDYCAKLFKKRSLKDGAFTIATAYLAGYTKAGKHLFQQMFCAMNENLWKAGYSLDMLEALGIMAGSPNAEPHHQTTVFQTFSRILEMKAPQEIGATVQTADGTVYEFGREIDFDTKVIPAVVRGLERICTSEQATPQLRTEIVKRFLIFWEGVCHLRIVWGPGGVDALIKGMSHTACCPAVDVQMRVRLGRALLRFLNKVNVVRSLGEICSQADTSGQLQPLCIEAAKSLISEWDRCDQQDDERKAALLNSLGLIAANTTLERDNEEVKQIREDALQVIFNGIREGNSAALEALKLLRDCPDIPKEQRKEINARISKVYGLQKSSAAR